MDIKILSAVLVTLFAIGTGMGQYKQELSFSTLDGLTDRIGELGSIDLTGLFQRSGEPNSTIQATFDFNGANSSITAPRQSYKSIQLRGGSGSITVNMEGFTTETSTVDLTGYDGTLAIHENITGEGEARVVKIGDTVFNSSDPRKVSFETTRPSSIELANVSGMNMELEGSSGEFSFADKTITVEESVVSLSDFTGTFRRSYQGGSSATINGKIYQAVFGTGSSKTEIGGD